MGQDDNNKKQEQEKVSDQPEKKENKKPNAEELGGDLGVTDGISGDTGQAGNLGSVEIGSGELGGKGTDR